MKPVCTGVALALLLALTGAFEVGAAQQGAASLTGRVVDEAGRPIAGAQVVARGAAETAGAIVTGTEGRFTLSPVSAGTYTVGVRAAGYRAVERRVAVAAGGATSANFTLAAAPVALSGVVVSATRTSVPVMAVPGAVTLVTREQIEQQAELTATMGAALTQLVPGLSAGTQSMSSYGQSFRGRKVVVLIDGVPQSTSRSVARDFVTIDPAMVERVEVLRGATSVYGEGATGGVINIITRRGALGPARFETQLNTESSLSDFGDGAGARITQMASGALGGLDYSLGGAFSRTGGFYDAAGDRIPSNPHGQGGISDLNSSDLFGKVGLELGEQRLQLNGNYFRAHQDTEYASDPAVRDADPRSVKARTIPGLSLSDDQGSENLFLNLDYTRGELLGSRVHAQAYYRDYLTRFGPYDARAYASLGSVIMQSFVDSEKLGGRFDVETELPFRSAPSLLWGLDFTSERTAQPVAVMDAAAFEQSGGLVFRRAGERVWVPPHDVRSAALFGQLAWSPFDRLLLRGGVRHERAGVQVDDFTTIAGVTVEGGELDYAPVLFNLGAVVDLAETANVYASFSQGFSLADIGRVLRAAPAGFSLGSNQTSAQEVDQYEVGIRGLWSAAQATVSAFRNESDLGTGFDRELNVVRAPERVYGVEATIDVQPAVGLDVGGTFSWTEGESFAAAADEWVPLDGYRIQPLKLTGYAEHQTLPGWQNRLQLLHSGSRDRLFRENPKAYGAAAVQSYTVVDWMSNLRFGPGTLNVGVQNLLNEQYFPVVSQLEVAYGNFYYAAGRGATLSLGYSLSY